MFLLKEIYQQLITESRVDFIRTKYKNVPDIQDNFDLFLNTDPTKNKIYLEFILKNYLKLDKRAKERFKIEDYIQTKQDLYIFDTKKNKLPQDKRDINKISDFPSLWNITQTVKDELSQTEVKKQKSDKLLDDGQYVVLVPKDHEAACFYGAGTRWCTASSNSSYQFDYYTQKDFLFIIIEKNNKDDEGRNVKYQFHFESGQFMDVWDSQIDSIRDYLSDKPQITDAIINYYQKNGDIKKTVNAAKVLGCVDKVLTPEMIEQDPKSALTDLGDLVLADLFLKKRIDVNTLSTYSKLTYEDDSFWIRFKGGFDENSHFFVDFFKDDYERYVTDLLDNGYSDYYSDYQYDYETHYITDLSENTIKEIKGKIVEQLPLELYDEYGDILENVTADTIYNYTPSELAELLDENKDFELEDLVDSIRNGISQAHESATQSAIYEEVTDSIIEGISQLPNRTKGDLYKFVGENLHVKYNYKFWSELSSKNSDNEDYDPFDGIGLIKLALNDDEIDKAYVNDNIYGTPSKEDLDECISNQLY